MSNPRPLRDETLLEQVREADDAYARAGVTGQLVVEIHYGSGVPLKAKIRREAEVKLSSK